MADPVELADSLYDDSIEVVGTVSPGAEPYKIRVKAALQTAIASHTSELADHESRLDAIESGTGDVDGPGSATDNAVARFDGTTGKLIQNSVVTIADSTGNMAGVGTLNTRTIANWVDGPSSVTDGRAVVFDGTTGKLVKQDTRLAADLVAGPASATDNAIVRFDGSTGKLVQNSAVTVADTTGSIDNTSGSGTMTSTRFIGAATKLRSATTDIDVVSATAPSSGQVLTATSSTAATWQTPATAAPSHVPFGTLTISSGVITMDLASNSVFKVSLTANVTSVVISNITNGDANFFTLHVQQDGTGGRSFAVPAAWKFTSGTYVVSSAANKKDFLQGVTYDDGTTWLVAYAKDFT